MNTKKLISIEFQTRYNGCTVEADDFDLVEFLEERIPSITHELCDEDGEWEMPVIEDHMDILIRELINTRYVNYNLTYSYDEYSS